MGCLSAPSSPPLAQALEALVTPLSDDGVLVLLERLALAGGQPTVERPAGGVMVGGDLAVMIAERLPDVHVASCLVCDDPTGEILVAVVASPDARGAGGAIARLQLGALQA
jgi:hypothetical protein